MAEVAPDMAGDITVIGSVFAALYVGHVVADRWLQTSRQNTTKGFSGLRGVLACARHAAVVTLAQAVVLVSAAWATDERPGPVGPVVVGLAVSAVSYWWVDRRRAPLARLAERIRVGKCQPYVLGDYDLVDPVTASCGTGAYQLDQAWHVAWLWIATLIII
jgi:hypothetical protein